MLKSRLALSEANDQGITLEASLKQVINSTSPDDPAHQIALNQLEALSKPIPAYSEHIWEWFWELNLTRTSGFSLNPLTYQEILSWATLKGIKIYPFEVDAIKRLDLVYLDFQNKKYSSKEGKK